MADHVTDEDIRAAALQYVRKISGMRAPSRRNTGAFEEAVAAVAATTRQLLDGLEIRTPQRTGGDPAAPDPVR